MVMFLCPLPQWNAAYLCGQSHGRCRTGLPDTILPRFLARIVREILLSALSALRVLSSAARPCLAGRGIQRFSSRAPVGEKTTRMQYKSSVNSVNQNGNRETQIAKVVA